MFVVVYDKIMGLGAREVQGMCKEACTQTQMIFTLGLGIAAV